MNITSLDKIKEMSQGEAVELSPFVEGEAFIARLKRPSLYTLAAKGLIPNSLLGTAKEVFDANKKDDKNKGGETKESDGAKFKSMAELLNMVAKSALAEPTYQQLEENGLSLTDMQLIEIFNYTQTGVKLLDNFRKIKANTEGAEPEPKI